MRIEVCAPNFEIAKAAAEAGANRLEICQALEVGGLTPSYSFIEKACALDIPIRVLIRPRPGNFQYSVDEMEMMLKDIEICERLGAEGVVIGALDEENKIDLGSNRIFKESSESLKFIFHRGIDLVGAKGFKDLDRLKFDGALCSGHLDGLDHGIEQMTEYSNLELNNFEIVAGGGLNKMNLSQLLGLNVNAIHFSCQKKIGGSESVYAFKHVFDNVKWQEIAKALK